MNKMVPHVFVLPEDDANRQLANGFQSFNWLDTRRMQILPEAGGWQQVLEQFKKEHVPEMERNQHRFMVLLIDFDGRRNRLDHVVAEIPLSLADRVFTLGTFSEPEKLRQSHPSRSYEEIGRALARDCCENLDVAWTHELLKHNSGELDRLRKDVRPILFPARSGKSGVLP